MTGTYILDFFNDPQDILDSFLPYYQTAELLDVSDPNQIMDLFEKLKASGIFLWQEVEQFGSYYYQKNKSQAALQNLCQPAVDRWKHRYEIAVSDYKTAKEMLARTKKTRDAVLIANAENELKEAKTEKDFLELFKKDLGTYVRQYEFMSQIVDYNDQSFEKLSSYARELRPMLRESLEEEDPIDLYNVELSHYRLSKIRQQDLRLNPDGDHLLDPAGEFGSGRAKDKKEDKLSHIIEQLNELFETEGLSDEDMVNYAHTVKDKIRENERVMSQLENNKDDRQLLHGDLPDAVIDAILDSSDVHQNLKMQLLSNEQKASKFTKLILSLLREAV